MGWAKIRDRIYKVGEKIEPHAYAHAELQKSQRGRSAFHEVEKGTATYGPYVALAAQVIPGVGTVVGLGVGAAATAAKYKLARDNQIEAIKDEREYQARYAAEVAAYNADPEGYTASLGDTATAFPSPGPAPVVAQTPAHAVQATESGNKLLLIIGAGVVVVALGTFLVLRKG